MKGNPSARLGHPIPPDPRILALPGALARTALLPLCLQRRGVCFLNDSQLETFVFTRRFPTCKGNASHRRMQRAPMSLRAGERSQAKPNLGCSARAMAKQTSREAEDPPSSSVWGCSESLPVPCPTENPTSPWGLASPAWGSGCSGEFAAPAGNEAGARLGFSAGSQ